MSLLHNGKEFDNMYGLNTYDYGARQYNPVTGRWDRMDPLCEKYYPTSPFAYCANNPINVIDPDGNEIYLVGTHKEQLALLRQLQSLTNDNLFMNKKTGLVSIGGKRWENQNKNLPIGTSLIKELVATNKQVDIQTNSDNRFHEWEYEHQESNASNGKGADCTISVDLNGFKTVMVENKESKTKQKVSGYIALGHELVHAYRATKGVASQDNKEEELITTGIKGNFPYSENKIREEHGLPKRIEY